MMRNSPVLCKCDHSHPQYTSTGVFDEFSHELGVVYTWKHCLHQDCKCDHYQWDQQMSNRTILDVKGVNCNNDHGLGIPCDGHSIKVVYHLTSDTVGVDVDDAHYTFDDIIWGTIIEAEIKDYPKEVVKRKREEANGHTKSKDSPPIVG